jgi:hypothetical protein
MLIYQRASPPILSVTTNLLLLPESEETDTRNLYDLESDTGNISLRFSLSTETRDEDLVVLIDKVEATIIGNESCDPFAVLDELYTNALSDSGVGLLGFDTDL